jgi:ubiquitin-activating enzyme E1
VVGAGGLGSELLKNLILMGVGCSLNGNITVTDIDRISKPNLVDQLLYQFDDVGRPKTLTAARALRNINPSAQIHSLQEKFDNDTEHIFDSSFFESIQGTLT